MTPKSPFRVNYTLTQGYSDNFNHYPEGHHGALDMVPRNAQDQPYPADIYPLFSGSTISIADTSPTNGEGIKEKVVCDADFITYLKSKGLVPSNYNGVVNLEILYWHILKVLDYDGTENQDTPIAVTGNTGDVYHEGKPVPNSEKGKPPYPGLHLHLETTLKGKTTFNLDKDVRGRIDPQIILAYKGNDMQTNSLIVKKGAEYGIYDPATSEGGMITLMRNRGIEPPLKPDGTLDFGKLDTMVQGQVS